MSSFKRKKKLQHHETKNVLRQFTCGSWLFGFVFGLRQYSSSVNGTTMPSFSASTFACNACFLKYKIIWSCTPLNQLISRQILIQQKSRENHFYSPDYVRILVVSAVWVAPSSIHYAGINVRRTECVRFVEQWNNRQENCSDVLCWIPALARQFTALRIIDGRMQDWYTQVTILVNIWMPDFCDESDGGWRVRIVEWKLHESLWKKNQSENPIRLKWHRGLFLYWFSCS